MLHFITPDTTKPKPLVEPLSAGVHVCDRQPDRLTVRGGALDHLPDDRRSDSLVAMGFQYHDLDQPDFLLQFGYEEPAGALAIHFDNPALTLRERRVNRLPPRRVLER